MAHPMGVVPINPPDQGFDANALERMRVKQVAVDMERGKAELRKAHIEHLKLMKQLQIGYPSIEKYWASVVGERNVKDAIALLNQEADAEIAQVAAEAALAAAKARKS